MQALRYPFAIGSGGLITLAIFYCLWRLISGPVYVLAHKPIPFPLFAFTHADTIVPMVRVAPVYPPNAAALEIEGWVQVQFSTTRTGRVTHIRVIDSAPKGLFEEATVQALQRWRYSPKVVNGRAVERVGVQTIVRFDLAKK
jgi:protein TonB